jgi:dihydrofolate synthase / folylpolyglutamate synthase
LVRPEGFEPPTFCSEDRRSNPLSYGRITYSVYYSNRVTTGREMRIISSFKEANDYLRQFHDVERTKYDTLNMRRLVEYLGNPQDKLKIIHIAGTSGKTSTAYFTSELLRKSGHGVGLTVSPIVDQINERIQVNGSPLSEEEFTAALSEFSDLLDNAPVKPSYFELMIAFAYWHFARENLDYGVIEVGLGGLKDGTNMVTRSDKVCIITDIGFDHMNVLGKTLGEITSQKAGIILPGNHVFMYRQSDEVIDAVKHAADEKQAVLHMLDGEENHDDKVPDYQYRNWRLAYEAYKYIEVRDGIRPLSSGQADETRLIVVPGRMDIKVVGDKTVIMDGAHNTQKMTTFIESFKKLYPGVRPAVMLAMKNGKDHAQIADLLSGFAGRIVTTTFTADQDLPIKSLPADELGELFKDKVPTVSITDQAEAYKELLNSEEGVLVITGSIYLLGQLRNNPAVVL